MTMTFVVIALGVVFGGLVLRRDPSSGLEAPVVRALAILAVPTLLIVLATELPGLQQLLLTQPLTGPQWLTAIGLALLGALVVEADKWLRRRRTTPPAVSDVRHAVNPERARTTSTPTPA